jgi:hypothetical protein
MFSRFPWGHLLFTVSVVLFSIGIGRATEQSSNQSNEREIPASVVFARVAPSVLVVKCTRKDGEIQGSAVVIDTDRVITSYHVVEAANSIQLTQGKQSWNATLLAFDQAHDLALLSVPQLDRPKVATRPSSLVKVGERTLAVGAPRGLELSLSDGLVAALRTPKGDLAGPANLTGKAGAKPTGTPASESATGPSLIQTTAPVSPGSSGGGLFDGQGRLIGIITFGSSGQNLNFAHPVEWVIELSQGPVTGKSPSPPPKPAPSHTISSRPPIIVCTMRTSATWAMFSGGTEMLESGSVTGTWLFEKFNSQLIRFSVKDSGGNQTNFVLSDMDRQSGFVRFSRAATGPRFELFFWMDDEGTFHITSAEGVDFYGQLRIRTQSGECGPPPAEPVNPAAIPMATSCKSGATALCMQEARNHLTKERPVEALQSFLTACDQGEPTGCEEAAKVCDKMKLQLKAQDLRRRAVLLRNKPTD